MEEIEIELCICKMAYAYTPLKLKEGDNVLVIAKDGEPIIENVQYSMWTYPEITIFKNGKFKNLKAHYVKSK